MRNTHFITESNSAQCALRHSHLVRTIGRMKTGEIIRKLRKEKKLTISEVESMAGLSDGNLSRIERGEQWLSEDKLFAVADALGVTPADFFTTEPKRGSGSALLHAVDYLSGEHPVDLGDVIQLISGFWESTPTGRQQILRMVKNAEKIKPSRDTSTRHNKR